MEGWPACRRIIRLLEKTGFRMLFTRSWKFIQAEQEGKPACRIRRGCHPTVAPSSSSFRIPIYAGFCHPWTSYRAHRDAPRTVVWAALKSWTHPLDASPGPALIEVNLGTAAERTDACAELTPAQARDLAAALTELAGTAERASGTG